LKNKDPEHIKIIKKVIDKLKRRDPAHEIKKFKKTVTNLSLTDKSTG